MKSSASEYCSQAAVWLLLAGIRAYQVILTPLAPSACKFYPTCSRYAAEAITKHGALRGMRLAAARLLRCRPFTRGGHDPVPEVASSGGPYRAADGTAHDHGICRTRP